MKEFFFSFRSVTSAQQGRQTLQKNGIRSVLARTPKALQTAGCGYGLRVAAGDLGRAKAVLRGFEGVFALSGYEERGRQ